MLPAKCLYTPHRLKKGPRRGTTWSSINHSTLSSLISLPIYGRSYRNILRNVTTFPIPPNSRNVLYFFLFTRGILSVFICLWSMLLIMIILNWWRKINVILFYSFLFYSILFNSILFYSILFYSILFYSILFFSILFYSILFYFILFYSILLYSLLFYSFLFYSILF